MLHNPPKALRYKSAQVCENQYDAGSLGSGNITSVTLQLNLTLSRSESAAEHTQTTMVQ